MGIGERPSVSDASVLLLICIMLRSLDIRHVVSSCLPICMKMEGSRRHELRGHS